MTPFQWFDRVYCINAIPERREAAEKRFNEMGIYPIFVGATPPKGLKMSNMRRNPGPEFGANCSHMKAILRALSDDAKRPLFLEDDVHFIDRAERKLFNVIKSVKIDSEMWKLMYLGGHPCEDVDRIDDNLVRVGRFSFAEAYSIRGVHHLENFADFWFDRIGQPDAMFDRILGEWAADRGENNAHWMESVAIYPPITYQPAGYSYIACKDDDKTHCIESGWRNHLKV